LFDLLQAEWRKWGGNISEGIDCKKYFFQIPWSGNLQERLKDLCWNLLDVIAGNFGV